MSLLLYFVFSAICCMLTAPLLTFALFPAIIWGFFLFTGGIRFGAQKTVMMFIFDILALYGCFGVQMSLFYILTIGVPSLVMGLMAAEKKDYYKMRSASFIMGIGGVILFYGFLMIRFGTDLVGLKTLLANFTDMYIQAASQNESLTSALYGGLSIEQISEMANVFGKTLFNIMPACFTVIMFLGVYFVLTFGSAWAVRRKCDWIKKLPLALEHMPWKISWILIAGLSLFLLDFNNCGTTYYIGLNLLIIMLPVGFYFGCAVLSGKFYLSTPTKRRIGTLFLFIAFLISARLVVIFIALLGFLDSIANYRHIIKIEHHE